LKIPQCPILLTLTECEVNKLLLILIELKVSHILEFALMPETLYCLQGAVWKAVSFSKSAVVQMGKHVCTTNVWIHKQKCREI